MEEMMTNEVMEQVAENTVDSVVSSGSKGSFWVKLGQGVLIYGAGKAIGNCAKKVWYAIKPAAKAKALDKKAKELEKEGFTVTKVQPELSASDFDVNDKDFE